LKINWGPWNRNGKDKKGKKGGKGERKKKLRETAVIFTRWKVLTEKGGKKIKVEEKKG